VANPRGTVERTSGNVRKTSAGKQLETLVLLIAPARREVRDAGRLPEAIA
jgi:hypothetical protein